MMGITLCAALWDALQNGVLALLGFTGRNRGTLAEHCEGQE